VVTSGSTPTAATTTAQVPVPGEVTGGWAPPAGAPISAATAMAVPPAGWTSNPVTPAASGGLPPAGQVGWTPAPAMSVANGWAPPAGTPIGTAPVVATGPVGWTPTFASTGAATGRVGSSFALQLRTDEERSDTSTNSSPASAASTGNSPVTIDTGSTDLGATPTCAGADDAAVSDALRSVARLKMSPTKVMSLPRLRLPAPAYGPKVARALKLRRDRVRHQRGEKVVGGPATVVATPPAAPSEEMMSAPAMFGATVSPARDVEEAHVPNASQESGKTEENAPISDGSRKRCWMGKDEDCGCTGFVQIRVQSSQGPPGKRLRMTERLCARPGSARTRSAHNPTIAWALEQRRTRNLRGSSQVVRSAEGRPDSPSDFWDRANQRSVSTAVVDAIRARADWTAQSSQSFASREVVLKPGTKRGVEGVEEPAEPSRKRRRRW